MKAIRYTVTLVRTTTEEATVSFVLEGRSPDLDLNALAAAFVPYGGWMPVESEVVRTSVDTAEVQVVVPVKP